MAIFKSGNPTLTEKMFDKSMSMEAAAQGTMSVRGTINKFGFLMLMVIAGAAYSWHLFGAYKQDTMMVWMMVGAIGGLITAIAISFNPRGRLTWPLLMVYWKVCS